MDIAGLIMEAKIGRERRYAQTETCAPFAAALYDVLVECGLAPNLVVVGHMGHSITATWYHLVVEHDGRLYDSMGEFSVDILRRRLKIHPRCQFDLQFRPESREGCFEEEDYQELHRFLVDAFRKAVAKSGFAAQIGATGSSN